MRDRRSTGLPFLPLLLGAVALLSTACGTTSEQAATAPLGAAAPEGSRLRVVTTVAPITSIAAAIIGTNAEITGVVPEGTNSHTFEPPPSAAEVLSQADVVFLNGLQLEEPTRELAEANRKDDSQIVTLGEQTVRADQYVYDVSFPKEGGKPNPHLWTNPPMARTYGQLIRDTMVQRDPAHADAYRTNFDAFSAEVARLDTAMRTAFATVPPANRKLLTYHDAYAYFAKEYGWKVIGAIQVADFEDPSPKEVADLIDQVRATKVPAIFGSEVFPSPVLEQIGRETGVRYVDVLRDDDLPEGPGAPSHSLVGLLRFDYATITSSLGGDSGALDALDVTIPVPDTATYPR